LTDTVEVNGKDGQQVFANQDVRKIGHTTATQEECFPGDETERVGESDHEEAPRPSHAICPLIEVRPSGFDW